MTKQQLLYYLMFPEKYYGKPLEELKSNPNPDNESDIFQLQIKLLINMLHYKNDPDVIEKVLQK